MIEFAAFMACGFVIGILLGLIAGFVIGAVMAKKIDAA
jgi:hypothetical protein